MNRLPAALLVVVAVAGLSGCTAGEPPTTPHPTAASAAAAGGQELPEDVTAALSQHDVRATDVREAITALDRVDQRRPLEVQASVRTDQVVFVTEEGETSVPIPGDEVYVSVAPYVDSTHECFYHALGGCQGEMVGEDVRVTVTADDGTVLVDEDATTYANGFVGFWLPKETTGTVTIAARDLEGQTSFDTSAEGPTCLTTLRLA